METLEKLFADHACLRRILSLLAQQLTAEEPADLQRMHALVTEYAAYFEHRHCPLEDHVLGYMGGLDAARQGIAEQALEEHRELLQRTALFCSLLDEALQGGAWIREDLVNIGWQFFDANLENMAREEKIALANVREALTATDWASIEAQL